MGLFTPVDVSLQQLLHFLHDTLGFVLMAPHSCDSRSLTVLAAPAALHQKKMWNEKSNVTSSLHSVNARVLAPSTVPAPLLAPGCALLTADPPVRAAATKPRQSALFLRFDTASQHADESVRRLHAKDPSQDKSELSTCGSDQNQMLQWC